MTNCTLAIKTLEQSDVLFVRPADIAPILGCDAQAIRVAARNRPELLGFPVNVMEHEVRIPRIPFLRFVGIAEEGGGHDRRTSQAV